MDIKEASAMTEASGLGDGRDRRGTSSATTAGSAKTMEMHPLVTRAAEQLRQMTFEAPLRTLALTFLFGIWVTRRR